MKKRKIRHIVLILLILFTGSYQVQAFKFKRVCVKGNDVILLFNNITDTCNKFISLVIYARENSFDIFKPVDTIKNPSVTDYIHINAVNKGVDWKYYLKIIRNCAGNDSIFSDTIAIDITPPNKIEIDSITVNNGKVEIGWKASAAKDTRGYIIYYVDISGNTIIDTVYGKNNTFYRDNGPRTPNTKIEKYRIASIDSCDNITVITSVHNTILHSSVQDTCKEEITLNWNKYLRWPDNETEYNIYFSKNGAPYTLAHKMTDNSSFYSLTGLENSTQYCFLIRAFNKDSNYSSTSNITCITTNFIEKPSYVYLRNVTVTNDQLDISWAIDKLSQIKEFRVYKSETGNPFSLFQTIPYSNNTEYSIIDNTVDVNTVRYRYYIEETDICNNLPLKSNEGGNILLVNQRVENDCFLNWNKYSEWAGGLKTQTIFIQTGGSGIVLDNPSITDENYKKTLSIDELKENSICFYIENEEGDTNKYGYQEISTSNITCLKGSPIVFIPNAFCPKGINTHFKPVGNNIDSTLTQIKIFNRWGQMIWSNTGITEGWNGRGKNNEEEPVGVYYYFILIIGNDKSKSTHTGNVTLVK